jgi:hypothetical protein
MKFLKAYISGMAILLFSGSIMVSCTKSFDEKTAQQQDFTNSSIMQVYVATVNASRNFMWVDSRQINGASLTTGSVFPTTGYGFEVGGGLRNFLVRDTLSTSTQLPYSFAENLQAGKNYTLFMYDTITSPKQKTVITNIEVPTDTTARIRFAHFPYSPTAIPAVDIFSVKRNANIFTNVSLTEVTGFIPIASGVTDTFYVRPAGTGTNLQNFNPSPAPGALTNIQAILTPTIRRSYTLIFRGGYRATATTNTTVRSLSVFVNR